MEITPQTEKFAAQKRASVTDQAKSIFAEEEPFSDEVVGCS